MFQRSSRSDKEKRLHAMLALEKSVIVGAKYDDSWIELLSAQNMVANRSW